MSEVSLYNLISLAASKEQNRLWRNNSGAFKDETGRWVRFGLGNTSTKVNNEFKTGDLIGVTRHVITKFDLGKTIGLFTNVEVKPENWIFTGNGAEMAQAAFNALIRDMGGIAGFVTSPEDYFRLIRSWGK